MQNGGNILGATTVKRRVTTIEEEVIFPDPIVPGLSDPDISRISSLPSGSGDTDAADANHCTVTMPPSIENSDMTHIKQYLEETIPPGIKHTAVEKVSHFTDTKATKMKQSYCGSEYIQMDHLQPGSSSQGQSLPLAECHFPLEPHVIICSSTSSLAASDTAQATPTVPHTGADPSVTDPTLTVATASVPTASGRTLSVPTGADPTVTAPTPTGPTASLLTAAGRTLSVPTGAHHTVADPIPTAPTASVLTAAGPTLSVPTGAHHKVTDPIPTAPTASVPTATGPTLSVPTGADPTVADPTPTGPTASVPTAAGPTLSDPEGTDPTPTACTVTVPTPMGADLTPADPKPTGAPGGDSIVSTAIEPGTAVVQPLIVSSPPGPEYHVIDSKYFKIATEETNKGPTTHLCSCFSCYVYT